jgi:hypothetical protein
MTIFIKLFGQFFIDLLYFPVWWYSLGTKRTFLACTALISDANSNLGPGLWLKNIFVPMFGQTDWQGRITSFFMRLVNVIGRGFGLLIWTAVVWVLFLIWLVLPVFIVFQIALSIFLHT